MATTDLTRYDVSEQATAGNDRAVAVDVVQQLGAAMASLKLTVALFAVSMLLVMAGTLAQIDHDIWYVIHNYFRTAIAWVDVQIFFPRSWDLHFEFPFPADGQSAPCWGSTCWPHTRSALK